MGIRGEDMKVLMLFILTLSFCSCVNTDRIGKYFAWKDCLSEACNSKCKDSESMGGKINWFEGTSEVVDCECYLRSGIKFMKFTFEEMECGPKPLIVKR